MSVRHHRKSSPSSAAKSGPMRATLPFTSFLKQGSSLRKSKSNSPTLSPTSVWKSRISPESLGQRSPGSLNYKAKSKTLNARSNQSVSGTNVIRRTASLDTIYLNGQWPRGSFYTYYGNLLVDKATQTDDFTSDARKSSRQQDAFTTEDAKFDKIMRQRIQRTNKEATSSRERTAAFNLILQPNLTPGLSSTTTANTTTMTPDCFSLPSMGTNTSLDLLLDSAISIPQKPVSTSRPPMRSSIEGLNQEIERLVLKSADLNTQDNGKEERKTYQATPEGHRAPLPEHLLRSTRSVNTQTPAGSSQSLGTPSCECVSPMIAISSRPASDLLCGSQGSTPDLEISRLGTSPHINKFLAREPPDGCEKISSKFLEDTRHPMFEVSEIQYCPLKPCVTLKPSLGSAFYPLTQASRSESTGQRIGEVSSTSGSSTLPLVPQVGLGDGAQSTFLSPFLIEDINTAGNKITH